ncbi:choice-of-anchor M domain-containing protein [Corynebacterium sp. MSK039]|uniref:choice-of-anchor M domain-containing protein n=1 Tax=Corynebacterium sp. MSK039 TaxID=3050193 RepID=UPI003307871D
MFIFSYLVSPRHGVFGRGRRGPSAPSRPLAQSRTTSPSRTAGRRVVGAVASVVALLGALVAIPASSGFLPVAAAQETDVTPAAEKPQDKPQHKPGDPSDNPTVPKDTIDPRTGKTHVCAGKKLLYQAHVDALYGTYRDGKLAVMVVDGMAVTNPEDVCIRLAPDADNEGKEVSRLVVPEGDTYSFLGKPGDILWHAPQQVDTWNGWRPVWAGAGAFDPHHEYEVPQNFVNDEVKFSLVGADKPGNVEMFFYSHALKEAENYISTKNGPTHFTYEVGAHGHFGWTFSKAGQYTFTWQVSTKTTDGKKLVSEPTPITWLVGSDEEVGLPEGTTKNLNLIKKSAEDQRAELFPDGVGSDEEEGKPGDSENPGGANPGSDAPGENGGDNGEQNPGESAPGNGGTVDPDHKPIPGSSDRVSIGHGHMDLAFSHKPGEGDVHKSWDALLIDGQNPSKLVNRPSGTFEFVIDSDRAKVSTPEVLRSALGNGGKEYGEKLWQIPQTQQEAPDVPWLGFNTEGANYGKLSKDGVKIGLKEFDGPGRMVTARGGIGQFDVLLDSAKLDKKITFRNPTHDHQAFMFSAPGRYRAVFEFQATTASGEKVSKELEAYFLVAPKEISSGDGEGSTGDGPDAGSGDGGGTPGIGENDGTDAGDIGGDGDSIGDGGDSGGTTGESNNKLVGILNETTGIVDSIDTGVGYLGEIFESVRGILGLSSAESSQPEAQPEITPGDAHAGDESGAGAVTGATSAGAAGATGGGPARTAGGAVTGGSSPSAGSHSSGASAGTSGGSGLSSSGAAPLALDAIDSDGGDSVDEGAEEELDGAESEGATEDSEYAVNAREGSADRGADKDQNAEPESKAIQLANALGQGGWIGGLMFGMGGMALLGGAFFAFIAWRLMRSNAAMAANGSVEDEAETD